MSNTVGAAALSLGHRSQKNVGKLFRKKNNPRGKVSGPRGMQENPGAAARPRSLWARRTGWFRSARRLQKKLPSPPKKIHIAPATPKGRAGGKLNGFGPTKAGAKKTRAGSSPRPFPRPPPLGGGRGDGHADPRGGKGNAPHPLIETSPLGRPSASGGLAFLVRAGHENQRP